MIVPARAAQFELKYGLDLRPEHPINVRSVEAFARIRGDQRPGRDQVVSDTSWAAIRR